MLFANSLKAFSKKFQVKNVSFMMENECQDQKAFSKVLELWTNNWKFSPQLVDRSIGQRISANLIKTGGLQLETNCCKIIIAIDISTNHLGKK